MATISVCMIVKNEENCLAQCLDSLKTIADEIIIVDTGSTDRTKEIAKEYTDKIFDFEWVDDFSKARNFAFSKASMDYVYTADADEKLDEENIRRFENLKKALIDDVEVVNMTYVNRMEVNTVYNFEKELRPKLYKRIRTLTWVDPIHETIRLEPIVFTSDIEIQHIAHGDHSQRDFKTLKKAFERDGLLSKKLVDMYAKELFICGDEENFKESREAFEWAKDCYCEDEDMLEKIFCVLARIYRIEGRTEEFMTCCLKVNSSCPTAEICVELGNHFFEKKQYDEALNWYMGAKESEPVLDINSSDSIP
ncbi:MAG: glycosyltransferase family 2 protein, partial [Clostridiales bacterium]|nr:glycosyltransferase family 2 protein [Clostridiales bacterium]